MHLNTNFCIQTNSEDLDQTAPSGIVCYRGQQATHSRRHLVAISSRRVNSHRRYETESAFLNDPFFPYYLEHVQMSLMSL